MYLNDYESEQALRSQTEGVSPRAPTMATTELGDVGFLPVAVIAPGISLVSSLFGGGGPSAAEKASAAKMSLIAQAWLNAGHADWVRSIAQSMSGPDWSANGGTPGAPNMTGLPWKTGYSPLDAQAAAAALNSFVATQNNANTPAGSTPYANPYGPDASAVVNAPGGTSGKAPVPSPVSTAAIPTWVYLGLGGAVLYAALGKKGRRMSYRANPRRKH